MIEQVYTTTRASCKCLPVCFTRNENYIVVTNGVDIGLLPLPCCIFTTVFLLILLAALLTLFDLHPDEYVYFNSIKWQFN